MAEDLINERPKLDGSAEEDVRAFFKLVAAQDALAENERCTTLTDSDESWKKAWEEADRITASGASPQDIGLPADYVCPCDPKL